MAWSLLFLCIPTYNHAVILSLTGWWVIRQAFMSMKRNFTHCGLSAGRRGISHDECPELHNGSPDPQTEWWLRWWLWMAPRGPGTVLAGAEWSPGEEEPHWTPHMLLFYTYFHSPFTEHKCREHSEHLATHVLTHAVLLLPCKGTTSATDHQRNSTIKSTLDWTILQVSGIVIMVHLSRTSSSTFCTKVKIHQEKEWIWQTGDSRAIFQ